MRIEKKEVTVYTVMGKEFKTVEEANVYLKEYVKVQLKEHCLGNSVGLGIEDECFGVDEDSNYHLAMILNILIDNNITSKKKLAELKESLITSTGEEDA